MANGIVKKCPEDILIYVLLTLPLKSLMRVKCVTKTFYTLIQSTTFINLHLNRSTTTKDECLLFKRSINRYKLVLSFISTKNDGDDLHPMSPDLDMSYLTSFYPGIGHRLMGPCNGLIALTDKVNAVLFNPATRHYRLLKPSPFDDCPLGFYRTIDGVGFGYDSIAKDYKIVRISVIHGDPPFYDFHMREQKVDVYELSTDSWRELDLMDQHLPQVDYYPCSEKFYNGASHWFGNDTTLVILCFDMSTEIFRNIKMPSACHSNDGKSYGLVVLNECLTLICYTYSSDVNDQAENLIDVWIMKEYDVNESWIKKYTIIRTLSMKSPLAVWKDHLILIQTKNGLLISYDLNSDEVKQYNLHGWPESLRATIYKECLTLIPKGSEHPTEVKIF